MASLKEGFSRKVDDYLRDSNMNMQSLELGLLELNESAHVRARMSERLK